MKHLILLLCTVAFSSIHTTAQNTELYILGTVHEASTHINADSIVATMERIQPDVILCELESIYFTPDGQFNLDKYPDLLTNSQENMSAYCYQQKTQAILQPYEIEGRNEFYRSTRFFEKQNKMIQDIAQAYQLNKLSAESRQEWERMEKALPLLDIINGNKYSLAMINTPLYCAYSEAKELLIYHTFVSIAKRDFPQWIESAKMMQNQADARNDAMAANILKWCETYRGKKLIVTCGQQHKAALTNRLKALQATHGFIIREVFE